MVMEVKLHYFRGRGSTVALPADDLVDCDSLLQSHSVSDICPCPKDCLSGRGIVYDTYYLLT